jgi:hypothetical protein
MTVRWNGILGPSDAALGGKLFEWSWVETPTGVQIPIVTFPSYTSKLVMPAGAFANYPGHWCILCSREGSGNVGVPFEVEA